MVTAPDSAPTEREGVVEVLAAHRLTASGGCSCGWTVPRDVPFIAALEAHTADALAPLIAERVRAARAEAWREGWLVGNRWAFSDADADAIDTNPYGLPGSTPELVVPVYGSTGPSPLTATDDCGQGPPFPTEEESHESTE